MDGYSTLKALNELETRNERPTKNCVISGSGIVSGQSMENLGAAS